jgi:hypothetical protein
MSIRCGLRGSTIRVLGEAAQLLVPGSRIREPVTRDHRPRHRIHDCRSVARLVRIDADHYVVSHHDHFLARSDRNTDEEGNATIGAANLS